MLIVNGLEDLPGAARSILDFTAGRNVFLFFAEMGTGKTTLIKTMCQLLGVEATVSSPTFSIVNEYTGGAGPIYHFDFYRIEHEEEAYDLGYEDYFYSGNYCFVEWPEKITGLWTEDAVKVFMEVLPNGKRQLLLEING